MDHSSVRRPTTSVATKLGVSGLRYGATRTSEWMLLCLIYLITTVGITILTTTTTIQYIAISMLEAVSAPPCQQHHCRVRKSLALGVWSYRRRLLAVQSPFCNDASQNPLLCAPQAEGLDHMFDEREFANQLYNRWRRRETYKVSLDDRHRQRNSRYKRKYHYYRQHDPQCGEEEEKNNGQEEEEKKNGQKAEEKKNEPHYEHDYYLNHSCNLRTPEQNLESKPQEHRVSIYRLPSFLQEISLKMAPSERSDSANSPPVTPITIHSIVGIMPRPGQPGALSFDGKGISDFLKDWNNECDEYGLSGTQKCKKLPRYCDKEIGEAIEKLQGYIDGDWKLFQKELKKLFWQTDPPKDTATALFKLINDARTGKISVDMYVLRYTNVTDSLVKKNAMSKFDRNVRLLEGLSEEIQSKVFEYCSEKRWRMLEHDVETTEPEFEEVREVVLEKAKMLERRKLFISGRVTGAGYAGFGASETPTSTATASTIPTTVTSPVPAPSDSMAELTKQVSKLALILEGQPPQQPASVSTPASSSRRKQWEPRCKWCDSVDHTQQCSELKNAIEMGQVGFNEKGRIKLMSTGEELPTMYGKGGMKIFLKYRTATTATVTTSSATAASAPVTPAISNAITFDDRAVGSLGEKDGSVRVTLLDFENGIRTDQIIDVEANEKRKRTALDHTRRVRSRIDDSQTEGSPTVQNPQPSQSSDRPAPNYGYPPPARPNDVPNEGTEVTNDDTQAERAPTNKPKYRLGSELGRSITTEEVGKKIMEAPIQLRMSELLAVSTDVSNFIHEQTRKKRIPITEAASQAMLKEGMEDVVSADANLTQVSAVEKSLYACPSARTKACLDDKVEVEALLDDGSELNIMAKVAFEQLQHPIDTEINWRINGYDTKAEEEIADLEKKGNLIGVCHDVLVDIGGVAVKQHIFVVRHLSTDLILGRPWERMTRAQKTNRDDGSYVIKIKSPDGRRMVEFIAVPAHHERIREYVRPDERGNMETTLKEPGVRH